MKRITSLFLLLMILTCHRPSEGKSADPRGCFTQDYPPNCTEETCEGVELVCDGVPKLIRHGKTGVAGRNGSPGARGEDGPKGEQGPSGPAGRSVENVMICSQEWEGVPAYKIGYKLFTYSDGIREAFAYYKTDKNEVNSNSSIWAKADGDLYDESQVDIGGFNFTRSGGSVIILYRSTGRTSDMNCSSL